MKAIKYCLDKNKACLKKLDRFGVPKASAEDGDLSHASALGGVISILFYIAIFFIIIYYVANFFNNTSPTASQSQTSAQTVDFSPLTTAQRLSYNQTFGVNVTINSTDFDFAVFFPWAYNITLDTLFSGGCYDPMAAYGNIVDKFCKLPYNVVLSQFSVSIIGDVDDPNCNPGIIVPMVFIGNSHFDGEDGRLYAPLYLNNITLGANYKIDILMELMKSTSFYISDFVPIGTTQNINYISFIYREYSFDAIHGTISQLQSYQLSYFPPGTGGPNVNSCTQVLFSPSVIQITEQRGIIDQTFNHKFKFSSWTSTSNLFYYQDLFGLCPVGSASPYSNGTTSSTGISETNCISNPSNGYSLIPYQPFKITITGSKFVTIVTLSYSNVTSLLGIISGIITLVMSIFAGLGGFVNSTFYTKQVKKEIENNIKNKELKIMDISNLDDEEKTVLLYSMNKRRKTTAKNNILKLKERDSHIDRLILDELKEEVTEDRKINIELNTFQEIAYMSKSRDGKAYSSPDNDQNHDIIDDSDHIALPKDRNGHFDSL